MIAKTFEIRDKATFIPILAVKLKPETEADRYLLARSGYGRFPDQQSKYVQIVQITGGGGKSWCDPYEAPGGGARTYQVATKHIIENFDQLESGSVVCVEHICGERKEPKTSEAKESGIF